MRYEVGMTIVYDVFSKSVLVVFREKMLTLPGPFADQRSAIEAGEQHCIKLGWVPSRL